jgi:hypothetical protein
MMILPTQYLSGVISRVKCRVAFSSRTEPLPMVMRSNSEFMLFTVWMITSEETEAPMSVRNRLMTVYGFGRRGRGHGGDKYVYEDMDMM